MDRLFFTIGAVSALIGVALGAFAAHALKLRLDASLLATFEVGVRYQMYDSADGHILFMSSEQAFWKRFCEDIGRPELFEQYPGSKYADHARGNRELQRELRDIFKSKTSAEWMAWAQEHDALLAPVNTPQTLADDPHFQVRMPWLPKETHVVDMLPSPVKVVGAELPDPGRAPHTGEHTDQILRDLLGLDEARVAELREHGAVH